MKSSTLWKRASGSLAIARITASTIGREKQVNPALTLDERAYAHALLAGLDAYPSYYAHMGPANLAGPGGAPIVLMTMHVPYTPAGWPPAN